MTTLEAAEMRIIRILRDYLNDEETVITPDSCLCIQVGLDSLDIAGFLNDVEVAYGITVGDNDLAKFVSINDPQCAGMPRWEVQQILTITHVALYVLRTVALYNPSANGEEVK